MHINAFKIVYFSILYHLKKVRVERIIYNYFQ